MNCPNCGVRLPSRAHDCPACGAPRPIVSTSALDELPESEAQAFREVVLTVRRIETFEDEPFSPRDAVRVTTRISNAVPRRAWSATRLLLADGTRSARRAGRRLGTNGRALGRRAGNTARRMAARSRSDPRKIHGTRRRVERRLGAPARRTKEAVLRD
jgi:hypothetical protein